MQSQCEICQLHGDNTYKECSIFIYPPHYRMDHSVLCPDHEEGMRKMVGDREQLYHALMEVAVRAPELEVGLNPIYVCQKCGKNFSSPVPERCCSICKKS